MSLRDFDVVKAVMKTRSYARLRQYLPMAPPRIVDDSEKLKVADPVKMEWRSGVPRPRCAIVPDCGPYPRWTKYRRFLEGNSFEYGILNLHAHNWLAESARYDVIMGIPSSEPFDVAELREKYYVLEAVLGKATYPSAAHARLYENKELEAYVAELHGIPFARTFVSYDREDAIRLANTLSYPVVSKVLPSSGSVGVELVADVRRCRRIIERAFSATGRAAHQPYFRQKNYVYLQEFVPNDGFDIRVILVGSYTFGYYRKVPRGDFRASGMGYIEKRALPLASIDLAVRLNQAVSSPMLVVDMLHGLDGKYYVIEYSPVCRVTDAERLHVDGIPGAYVARPEGGWVFRPGRYWVHELALREFFLTYLRARAGAGDESRYTPPDVAVGTFG